MKYKYYFTPSKLNQKLRKIHSNNNFSKEILYKQTNHNIINVNNIKSIPSLTHKFCYLKNKTKILKDSLNKIPLLSINQEYNNDIFPLHKFKRTKNISNINSYNSPTTQYTTPKQNIIKNKYLPYKHKRNNTEISLSINNFGNQNHKFDCYCRNNNLNTHHFTIEDCKKKYEEKIIKLNEKLSNKNKIIHNMQNLIDETLMKLKETNKKNEMLQNKLNRLNAKIEFNKIYSKN